MSVRPICEQCQMHVVVRRHRVTAQGARMILGGCERIIPLPHPLRIGDLPLDFSTLHGSAQRERAEVLGHHTKGVSHGVYSAVRTQQIRFRRRSDPPHGRGFRRGVQGPTTTPDSPPWSARLSPSALSKRRRRASAIRFACAMPDWPLWDTTGKRFRPAAALALAGRLEQTNCRVTHNAGTRSAIFRNRLDHDTLRLARHNVGVDHIPRTVEQVQRPK